MEKAQAPTKDIPKPEKAQTPINRTTTKSQPIKYRYAGKETMTDSIIKVIPKQLIPTKRINSIFGSIFLLVIIIAAFQLPYSEVLSGNVNTSIEVGYPLKFLELGIIETESTSVKFLYLILDIIIYILLAYIIDVILNSILKNPLIRSKDEKKKIPTVFKNKKPTFAEKATEKIIKPKPKQLPNSAQPST